MIDGAPRLEAAESSRCLVSSPQAPRLARGYLSDMVGAWGFDGLEDDAAMVVTELVTNAVLHAGGHLSVGFARGHDHLRILVSDSSHGTPKAAEPAPLAVHGRGLRIVETVARAWGFDLHDAGKVVWAELAL